MGTRVQSRLYRRKTGVSVLVKCSWRRPQRRRQDLQGLLSSTQDTGRLALRIVDLPQVSYQGVYSVTCHLPLTSPATCPPVQQRYFPPLRTPPSPVPYGQTRCASTHSPTCSVPDAPWAPTRSAPAVLRHPPTCYISPDHRLRYPSDARAALLVPRSPVCPLGRRATGVGGAAPRGVAVARPAA